MIQGISGARVARQAMAPVRTSTARSRQGFSAVLDRQSASAPASLVRAGRRADVGRAPLAASRQETAAPAIDWRQLFGGAPGNQPPAAAPPATTPATTPAGTTPGVTYTDWRQLFNGPVYPTTPAPVIPKQPAFVPEFQTAVVRGPNGETWGLNSTYFAAPGTAQWIANKYGTGEVVEVPSVAGFYQASANELHIKLADGRTVNAGILAGYYQRNPEAQFPGVADRMIRNLLGI